MRDCPRRPTVPVTACFAPLERRVDARLPEYAVRRLTASLGEVNPQRLFNNVFGFALIPLPPAIAGVALVTYTWPEDALDASES